MKRLLTFVSICYSAWGFTQNFAYSYNGVLTENSSKQLEQQIEEMHFFKDVKIRIKENSGQLFFTIPVHNSEGEAPYGILDIKALLLNAGLEPNQIIERH